MILEKNNVAQCARMTKIHLTPEEEKAYESQLADLFNWVEDLSKVDTSSVEEAGTLQAAYLRPDEPVVNEPQAQMLVQAFNSQQGHCAKVKKVL